MHCRLARSPTIRPVTVLQWPTSRAPEQRGGGGGRRRDVTCAPSSNTACFRPRAVRGMGDVARTVRPRDVIWESDQVACDVAHIHPMGRHIGGYDCRPERVWGEGVGWSSDPSNPSLSARCDGPWCLVSRCRTMDCNRPPVSVATLIGPGQSRPAVIDSCHCHCHCHGGLWLAPASVTVSEWWPASHRGAEPGGSGSGSESGPGPNLQTPSAWRRGHAAQSKQTTRAVGHTTHYSLHSPTVPMPFTFRGETLTVNRETYCWSDPPPKYCSLTCPTETNRYRLHNRVCHQKKMLWKNVKFLGAVASNHD